MVTYKPKLDHTLMDETKIFAKMKLSKVFFPKIAAIDKNKKKLHLDGRCRVRLGSH